MEQLELYIPKLEDLWFYQKMMSDPETMAYNANWDVDYDGYHKDTGCIDYLDEVLPDWYKSWVGREPERFCAYIKRSSDGAWIGAVNFHYTPRKRVVGYGHRDLCALPWERVCSPCVEADAGPRILCLRSDSNP